jgi:hypothetical protein
MSLILIKIGTLVGGVALCLAAAAFVFECIVSNTRMRKWGWVTRIDEKRIVSRKPLTYRLFMGLGAFCFLDAFFLGSEKIVVEKIPPEALLNLPNCLVCLGLGLLLWKEAGPQTLSIDLQDRTFQATTGWPLAARSLNGPLDGSGVVKAMGESAVALQPSASQPLLFMVGALLIGSRSIRIADTLSEATGLPVKLVGIKRGEIGHPDSGKA